MGSYKKRFDNPNDKIKETIVREILENHPIIYDKTRKNGVHWRSHVIEAYRAVSLAVKRDHGLTIPRKSLSIYQSFICPFSPMY